MASGTSTPLLEGRTAVITGGARGIGLAIATTFVAHAGQVVIGDLDERAAAEAAEALGTDRCLAMACDVTSASDVSALVAGAVERFGSIEVMVNNAGITRDKSMRKMDLEDFRAVINIHLVGTWLGTRAAADAMRGGSGSGSIINISSISGKVGNFGQTNYSAAKAGIVGLTKAAAKEVARDGTRVNAIQPGLIRTAMTEAMPQTAWESKMAEIPMGRAGEPSEVADVALFLASGLSSYLTGTVLEVTGGRYM